MKKESDEAFMNAFQQTLGPSGAELDAKMIQEISENHLDTLTSIRNGYFPFESLKSISHQAGEKLASVYLKQNPKNLMLAWREVAEDFHSQNYWGFQTQTEKPKVVKKKNELIGFLWILFQAAIVMKLVVLYFGVNASQLDSEAHYLGLAIAIFVSFSSLFYFAYRKSKTYKD